MGVQIIGNGACACVWISGAGVSGKENPPNGGFLLAARSSSDLAALLGAIIARFKTGLALGVVLGVCLAGIGALFAGFSTLFGNGSQQGCVLCSQAVGRVAQRQHLIDRFGAVGHALVAFGKETDAVREAGAASAEAGGGGLDERVVRVGSRRTVRVMMMLFGAGSRGESEGSGSSAAKE